MARLSGHTPSKNAQTAAEEEMWQAVGTLKQIQKYSMVLTG